MSESFDLDDEAKAFANRNAELGYVEVFTESDYEGLVDRSGLGVGLARITSQLLRQLATGGECIPYGGVANARNVQRDTRGNLVPWDDSPIVAWKRVVAVSAAGRVLALVSPPLPSGTLRAVPGASA
jgi:hypothetical protein